MGFGTIREAVKSLELESLRMDCDNYIEAVVVQDEMSKLNNRLKKFFGKPAWPSKNRLTYEVQETINGFGGLMPGQTLYFKNADEGGIFAMLWPWQDGSHTTIKVILK
jgi:hypothetical protein